MAKLWGEVEVGAWPEVGVWAVVAGREEVLEEVGVEDKEGRRKKEEGVADSLVVQVLKKTVISGGE
jgi:hypothetical protein